ncbi:MAG: MBOAT family protein [Bacteroidales bacterium]|nr:MBOAT family protein [Bacteroidales bacterium]
MVFSSHIFLLYFLPLFLLAYFLVPARWRNGVLLAGSVIFYAWGAPDFIAVLLAATVATFYLVRLMDKTPAVGKKKLWCAVALAVNLGLLAYFKYANFFVDNLAALGVDTSGWVKVLLPIGISFFTFQSVTYVVDTYRGVNKPMERLTDYVVYIIMFPQLIAGPIVRYNEIADQVTAQRRLRWDECLQGFYRFVIGLAKKVLIADVIGQTVDTVLGGDLAALGMGEAWITLAAYTMQLYFDFSGYSDMAIGLGRIMGFKFPENFDNPYVSTSVTEFWRRWHITLGTFMRNYLYIPLGGNRKGVWRTYFNLWVVFLLSGLWHGAGWNFVLWGAYHGFFLVLERILTHSSVSKAAVDSTRSSTFGSPNLGEQPRIQPASAHSSPKLGEVVRRTGGVCLTFVVVMVGWALFRIENLADCWTFIARLFSFNFIASPDTGFSSQFIVTLIVALAFAFVTLFPFGKKLQQWTFHTDYTSRQHLGVWIVACLLLFFCIGALTATDFSPFIYFRF